MKLALEPSSNRRKRHGKPVVAVPDKRSAADLLKLPGHVAAMDSVKLVLGQMHAPRHYRAKGDKPSTFASALLKVLDDPATGATRVSTRGRPPLGFTPPRGVYRFPDGTVCKVFDSGATVDTADSK